MDHTRIGIIGGTGLSEVLEKQVRGEKADVDTPFGPPSSQPIIANWEGAEVVFISRHGPGHCLNPSAVPYRANIWAMKQLGVSAIIASGATGSLREEIEPGHLVVCDQVIDRTFRRENTFFDAGLSVHVELADPFCPQLRALLTRAAEGVQTTVHPRGTYVCMEGPQFSTRAESEMHRQLGGDLIGMTCMPEAKLAREAEICYALVAFPTDYDCWRRPGSGPADQQLLREILANLKQAGANATILIREALRHTHAPLPPCRCQNALQLAIWSDKGKVDPDVRQRLGLLVSRYTKEH